VVWQHLKERVFDKSPRTSGSIARTWKSEIRVEAEVLGIIYYALIKNKVFADFNNYELAE
jgi:hypothetical protein